MSQNDIRILLVTAPAEAAPTVASAVLDARLAACVNLVPGVRSLFWWRGSRDEAEETLLVLKTRRDLVARATAAVVAAHPYDVPEVLVLAVEDGHPDYLEWVRRETAGA
jgi:periplasmic divalent cation tolerance protein